MKNAKNQDLEQLRKRVMSVEARLRHEEVLFQMIDNIPNDEYNFSTDADFESDDGGESDTQYTDYASERDKVEREYIYSLLSEFDKKVGLRGLYSLLIFRPEYMDALNALTNNMYNFEYIYKSRYIRYIKEKSPSFYNNHKDQSFKDFLTAIEEQFAQDSSLDTKPVLKYASAYSTFKKDQLRILSKMLKGLLMDDLAYKKMKDNKKTSKFGVYEFGFFSFLIDTAVTDDGKKLCNSDFSNLSFGYYCCMKLGINMLSRYHQGIDVTSATMEMKKYNITSSKSELIHAINQLMKDIKPLLAANDCSPEAVKYVDYITAIINNARNCIDDIINDQ